MGWFIFWYILLLLEFEIDIKDTKRFNYIRIKYIGFIWSLIEGTSEFLKIEWDTKNK